MTDMQAFRLADWGKPPRFTAVAIPEPGPGEILMKMGGAGLCGSDLHLMHAPAGAMPFASGFTLGHENAGWVESTGSGVRDLKPGDAILASSATSCGRCDRCVAGLDNYCRTQVHMGTRMMSMLVRGIGLDGGLAKYLVVPARDVVRLATLSPVQAAPLADAGATSYHAVMTARDELKPGAVCVVIGVGGLGSFAVQYLRLLTGAKIIALDINAKRRDKAIALGADAAYLPDDKTLDQVLRESHGDGAAVVLDFVGSNDSLLLASTLVQPHGRVVVPGISMGSTGFGWGITAPGARFNLSLGFTIADLRSVVALAEAGRLNIGVQTFSFDQIETAYGALASGELDGRAVITFD